MSRRAFRYRGVADDADVERTLASLAELPTQGVTYTRSVVRRALTRLRDHLGERCEPEETERRRGYAGMNGVAHPAA